MARTKQVNRSEKKGTRKKRKFKPGTKSLRTMKKLQKTTNLLAPKAPMRRIFTELCDDNDFRFSEDAKLMLHEASEQFLIDIFRNAQESACFNGRVQIKKGELQQTNKDKLF